MYNESCNFNLKKLKQKHVRPHQPEQLNQARIYISSILYFVVIFVLLLLLHFAASGNANTL